MQIISPFSETEATMNDTEKAEPVKHKLVRVPRASEAMQALFRKHVKLLVGYCRQFDAGDDDQALPISLSLRTFLFKNPRANAVPLLERVGLWTGEFFSIPPRTWRYSPNPIPQCDFVHVRERGYVTRLPAPSELDRVPIDTWWETAVIMGRRPHSERLYRSDEPNPIPLPPTMSRKDIVKSMADMEAGHVDEGLTPVYHSFTTGVFLGWERDRTEGVIKVQLSQRRAAYDPPADYFLGPECGCIRAIAHELLLSMQEYAKDSFEIPYIYQPTTVPPMNMGIEPTGTGPIIVQCGGCPPGIYMKVKDQDWHAKK
jgi:hypothetical protein